MLLLPLDYWYTSSVVLVGLGLLSKIAVSSFLHSLLVRAGMFSFLSPLSTLGISLGAPARLMSVVEGHGWSQEEEGEDDEEYG